MRDRFRIYSCSAPTAENARLIAYAIKRHIIETKEQVKRTPNFVKRTHSKIVYLHNYNCRVAQVISIYPLENDLKQLLIKYIELELSILKNPEYNTDIYRLTLEKRLLTLLSTIYSKYCFYTSGKCNPSVTWHQIIELFDRVPYDVHKFFEDIQQKVVDKIDFGQDNELLRRDTILEKSRVTCYKEIDDSVEVELNRENDPLLRCCETFNILPEVVEKPRSPLQCAEEVIDTGQPNDDDKRDCESMFLPSLAERLNSLKHSTMLMEDVKPEIIDICDETPQRTGYIRRPLLPRNSIIDLVDSSDDENVNSVINLSEDSCRNEIVTNRLSRTETVKSSEVLVIDSSKSGQNDSTFRTRDEAEILRLIREFGASEVIIEIVNNKLVISPKDNLNSTDVNISSENQGASSDIMQITQSSPKPVEFKHVNKDVPSSTKSQTHLETQIDNDCNKDNTLDIVPSSTESAVQLGKPIDKDCSEDNVVSSSRSPVYSQTKDSTSQCTSNTNFQDKSTSSLQKNDLSNPQTVVIYKSSFDSESLWASCESFRSIYETEFENELPKSPELISASNEATSGTRSSRSEGKNNYLDHAKKNKLIDRIASIEKKIHSVDIRGNFQDEDNSEVCITSVNQRIENYIDHSINSDKISKKRKPDDDDDDCIIKTTPEKPKKKKITHNSTTQRSYEKQLINKYDSLSSGHNMSGSTIKSETKLRENKLSVEQKKSTDEVSSPQHVTADSGEVNTDFSMHSEKAHKTSADTDIGSIKDAISKPEIVDCKYSAIMLGVQNNAGSSSELLKNQELGEKVPTSGINSVAQNEESKKFTEVDDLNTELSSKQIQLNTPLLKSSSTIDSHDDISKDDVAYFELSLVTEVTATVLPGDVEFLEEYPCTSPENVLPNYKNETIKASLPTASISQHSENTRDNVDINTSESSFQKGDHTYTMDALINGQTIQKKKSSEYTGEYGKPIAEFEMDELLDLGLIDESSTPASGILCSSSSMNFDVGWSFNVEPGSSNEIPSWDEILR